jgi:molybdopterin synthase catalytic subunit
MFTLHATPLDAALLRRDLLTQAAGALVVFEGWVRDHSHGRTVIRLDYEGAEQLAAREFSVLAGEAKAKFGVLALRCAHRVGSLQPGEAAVWVGVISAHRGAAFDACRYVIDELKKRLPVWKKEFYADGDSGWINAP